MEWITTYWLDLDILAGASGIRLDMGLPTCTLIACWVAFKLRWLLPKRKTT